MIVLLIIAVVLALIALLSIGGDLATIAKEAKRVGANSDRLVDLARIREQREAGNVTRLERDRPPA